MRCSLLGLVVSVAVMTGCTPGICSRSSDCNSGLVCTTLGVCVIPPDASTVNGDAGTAAVDAAVEIDAAVSIDASIDASIDTTDAEGI
jgi:hypothetical protein